MFFPGADELPVLDVKVLLEPFFLLDKSKVKADGDDGDACFKKFSNEGHGVPRELVIKLSQLATAIRSGKYIPNDWLRYVDLFTLYSNHIDQQRFDTVNPKPYAREDEKGALVLNFLEAAYALSPKIDMKHLEIYSPRFLSGQAQLLHYLGKARRYEGMGPEARIDMLMDALTIARYLGSLACSEEMDPHAYRNRIPTAELPVCYCLQDLKRYDEAAALITPQLSLPSAFHVAQAQVQLANIYMKKQHDFGNGIAEALLHARDALSASKASGNTLIEYNARVCLMNALKINGDEADAQALALAIIEEMDTNPLCGAKPLHRKAAEEILGSVSASFKP